MFRFTTYCAIAALLIACFSFGWMPRNTVDLFDLINRVNRIEQAAYALPQNMKQDFQ